MLLLVAFLIHAASVDAAYTPSEQVTRFHQLPRYNNGGNIISTDVTIGADPLGTLSDPRPGNKYIVGVMVPGVTLIIAGIVFFLAYTFAYWCACCRCCGCCGHALKVKRESKRGVHIALVVFALASLGLILSGIAALPGFVSGIDGLLATTDQAVGVFSSAVNLLSQNSSFSFTKLDGTTVIATSVFKAVNDAGEDAATMFREMHTNIPAPSTPACNSDGTGAFASTAFCMALKNVGLAIQRASSTAIDATAPLRGASSQFKDALTSVPIASVKNMIFLAGVIVLAVIAGVIALQSVMLCRSWCACCVFKSFAWLSVLLTALVFVLAGIFFIIGLPGSDVCFAPSATLNNLVGTREPTGTLSYYLTCDPSSPASGAVTSTSSLHFINSAKSLLDRAKSDLSAIVVDSSLTPYLSPAFIVASTRLPTRVDAAISAVGLIVTDVVSCKSIGNVFDTLWNGLCGGFITSAITLASVLTAAAALLAVQMSLGVEVCCRHPGDADRWEGDTVEARGLSIRKIPAPIEGNGKAPLQSVSINYV